MRDLVAKFALLPAAALAAPAATAQVLAPDAMLRAVAVEVIDEYKQDQIRPAPDPAKVSALVEARILPLFDFVHMTRLAMARNWRLATPEQQRMLTEEFSTLLVHTYSAALSSYRDQVIEFRGTRTAPADSDVTVRSVVKQSGTEPVAMDYDMEKTPAGWKVYDIKVAGVSLVTTYRDTFSTRIRADGVDGLIKALADKNRQGDAPAKAAKT